MRNSLAGTPLSVTWSQAVVMVWDRGLPPQQPQAW